MEKYGSYRDRTLLLVKQCGSEVWECVLVQFGYVKIWNKVRSSEIEIDKLHQVPPIYHIVVDCYSEVTGSITNNKTEISPNIVVLVEEHAANIPATHTRTKYSLDDRCHVLRCNPILSNSFISTPEEDRESKRKTGASGCTSTLTSLVVFQICYVRKRRRSTNIGLCTGAGMDTCRKWRCWSQRTSRYILFPTKKVTEIIVCVSAHQAVCKCDGYSH
jgi:hypothetical protein